MLQVGATRDEEEKEEDRNTCYRGISSLWHHTMPYDHMKFREAAVNKQERKAVSLSFGDFILKYLLWQNFTTLNIIITCAF